MAADYAEVYKNFNLHLSKLLDMCAKYRGDNHTMVRSCRRGYRMVVQASVTAPYELCSDYINTLGEAIRARRFMDGHRALSNAREIITDKEVKSVFDAVGTLYDELTDEDKEVVGDILITLLDMYPEARHIRA